jgi:outer membrane lipoprotein-sorting protein
MRFSLLAIVPWYALAAAAPDVLSKVDEAAAGFRSVSADIRQVYHVAVINDDNVDTGVMRLKRPRPREFKMLIDITAPDAKTVAVGGGTVEVYYPKIKTVQVYDLGKNRGLVDQFLLLGFGSSSKELAGAYNIRNGGAEMIAGQRTTRLELTPKTPEVLQHLSKVDLWLSDATGYPVQQKFHLPGGDYRMVTYTNVKINPDLADSALKLQVPRGVKREYPQK